MARRADDKRAVQRLVDEVYFFGLREGRVSDYWGVEDNLSRPAQLGMLPE